MPRASSVLVLVAALMLPASALGNGQSTHVWITLQALERLPPGPVRDLLGRPELRDIVMNGAMFPDWGYAPGGSRDHGEAAHWEPFQQEYRRWIQETWTAPYTDAVAAEQVAFLFGMASHGMADEHFDSLFMERSRLYDAGWNDPDGASLDTASDVLFMAAVGGIPQPERWLPTEALTEVYARAMPDLPLDPDAMEFGHRMLHVAIGAVEELRQNQERVDVFTAAYPWTAEQLTNEAMPGSPPDEAEAVVAYWLDLWERLQGTPGYSQPVLMMRPAAGSFEHPLDHLMPESRVHLAFARGVLDTSLASVRVATGDGEEVPVDVGLFYGNASHALLARPTNDWEPDTDYVITVDAGLQSYDGDVFEGSWSGAFSTKAPPPEPPPSDDPPPTEVPPAGCGASLSPAAPAPLLLLLFTASAATRWRRRRPGDACVAPGGPRP